MSSPADHPEPDPFSPAEFDAWRGLLRLHATVTGELQGKLADEHAISLAEYAVLITLVTEPDGLRMTDLAARRLITPSGISRVVDKLERRGLVARQEDPSDRRGFLSVLTEKGLRKLREAQVTHHAHVRETYLERLTEREQKTLARLLEKAMPGVVSSAVWPPGAVPAPRAPG
jgi:DNA-binding MarR family transcriptional regulator